MNATKKFTYEELGAWLKEIKQAAKEDKKFEVSFFPGTRESEVCIMAGWTSGFGAEYSDLLCICKSEPSSAMCITLVKNPGEGDMSQQSFDSFDFPECDGEEEDITVAIELDDMPEAIADFYAGEWERLTNQ